MIFVILDRSVRDSLADLLLLYFGSLARYLDIFSVPYYVMASSTSPDSAPVASVTPATAASLSSVRDPQSYSTTGGTSDQSTSHRMRDCTEKNHKDGGPLHDSRPPPRKVNDVETEEQPDQEIGGLEVEINYIDYDEEFYDAMETDEEEIDEETLQCIELILREHDLVEKDLENFVELAEDEFCDPLEYQEDDLELNMVTDMESESAEEEPSDPELRDILAKQKRSIQERDTENPDLTPFYDAQEHLVPGAGPWQAAPRRSRTSMRSYYLRTDTDTSESLGCANRFGTLCSDSLLSCACSHDNSSEPHELSAHRVLAVRLPQSDLLRDPGTINGDEKDQLAGAFDEYLRGAQVQNLKNEHYRSPPGSSEAQTQKCKTG